MQTLNLPRSSALAGLGNHIANVLTILARSMESSSPVGVEHPCWIAGDPASLRLQSIVEKVKDTGSTLLIQGESGTGKDLLALTIHHLSSRRDEPFLKIDCSSIPSELIESELFGYSKGAFTGAYKDKPGKLEFAGQGTVVLDEISSLGLDVQTKLLRVIEERVFERLGSHIRLEINARIIALSRENLEELVRAHGFREDLFFRLNVIPIRIPALRERPGDIVPLTKHFLRSIKTRFVKPDLTLSTEAVACLEKYSFPGNVRELRNLLERATMLAEEEITPSHLPDSVRFTSKSVFPVSLQTEKPSLAEIEKRYISEILDHTRGNKGRAAKILGISRKTLLEKRKRYGLVH